MDLVILLAERLGLRVVHVCFGMATGGVFILCRDIATASESAELLCDKR